MSPTCAQRASEPRLSGCSAPPSPAQSVALAMTVALCRLKAMLRVPRQRARGPGAPGGAASGQQLVFWKPLSWVRFGDAQMNSTEQRDQLSVHFEGPRQRGTGPGPRPSWRPPACAVHSHPHGPHSSGRRAGASAAERGRDWAPHAPRSSARAGPASHHPCWCVRGGGARVRYRHVWGVSPGVSGVCVACAGCVMCVCVNLCARGARVCCQ